ncbi:MAG TPA: DNA repair protein RecO [Gammaproteobacteria bacterium]|nr:DNA repair protein RecO [Gammaproteobacteria bacterium]
MQTLRVDRQPAYVLHRRPYRNNSLLLELLTRDYGRVAVMARGARQPKSRYHGQLIQFQPLLIGWSAKGGLGTLIQAERNGNTAQLQGRRLACGLYVNELLMRLVHRDDPCLAIFQIYVSILSQLAGDQTGQEAALRLFERDLLEALGYGMALDRDVETGEAIRPECVYNYFLDKGPVRAANGGVPGSQRAGVVQLKGSSLNALAQGRLNDGEVLREAKRLTRMTLGKLLGNKPLNSRSLFRDNYGTRREGAAIEPES